MKTTSVALLALLGATQVEAHGRMLSPLQRGSMFRLSQFSFVPEDWDDDGLNAGGIGSKHGVCGDPYGGTRHHETGGKYALFPKYGEKAIAACYKPGSTIDIDVQITANHRGSFTFGLCKLNGKNDKETEECFTELKRPNGETKWKLPGGNKNFKMQYTLPEGVTCSGDAHCVLRWWYTGGNNPGGADQQEQFWNCADINISDTCDPSKNPNVTPVPTDRPSPNDGGSSSGWDDEPTDAPKPTTKPTHAPTTKPTTKPSEKPTTKPSEKPTTKPTKKPSEKPTKAPAEPTQKPIDIKDAKKAWEQCGGKDYTGNTECVSGTICSTQDEWYSQCIPKRLR
ncbi:hypothetical protein SDRG_14951 [Saprolegnia diclina VS20]|uniref:CBM1 domain-containing protein n=1 Tax=Saprolegnia diclina (strain VS20) TaxID=1156394 RepID=T0PP66_SAPDV|nr:hypothetical protein SDRG_14951 [Saprolegnia diclina VS20]EQC27234.1 hypothetical protein SDRG_14951 [Saprolegnia diclina VS20]|eukprot:XP_008619333.1 hypothetical protein SDRG_14951 [Saprolegnia diclina VS20]